MKRSVIEIIACAMSLFALGANAHRGLAAVPRPVVAQPTGDAAFAMSDETLGNFDDAFGTISNTAQVTIVAEGVPLRQSLAAAEASGLNRSLSGPDVDFIEEMTLVALAYDYDIERVSKHCFLLRKRHSDPNDLPDVTYAEVVYSLRAVLDTIDSILPEHPDPSGQSSAFDLYASLTPEQLSRAHDGISLSELDPMQRKLALSTAAQFTINAQTAQLRSALNQLSALQDDRTVFTWTSISGGLQFGFEGPFGPNGAIARVPFGTIYKARAGSYSAFDFASDSSAYSAIPTESDRRLAGGMLSNRLPSTLSLGEFSRSIAPGETESGLTLSVDPAVEGKPICLFGANFTPTRRLIRDVAALYGLRVETADNYEITLSLPRRGAIRAPEDAPAEFARLIPPSLVRYQSWQPWSIEGNRSGPAEDPQTPSAKRIAVAQASRNENYINTGMVTAQSYYVAAVKRLRILAEPLVPTRTSPPVRVNALGPEPERLIALMTLAGRCISQLGAARKYSPAHCFFDLDKMIVQISGNSNAIGKATSRSILTKFGYLDENGEFKSEIGGHTMTVVGK